MTDPTDLKIQVTLRGLWLLEQKDVRDLGGAKEQKGGRKTRRVIAIPLDVNTCTAGCVMRGVSTFGPL